MVSFPFWEKNSNASFTLEKKQTYEIKDKFSLNQTLYNKCFKFIDIQYSIDDIPKISFIKNAFTEKYICKNYKTIKIPTYNSCNFI